jgi:hypothetical protein
MIKLSDYSKYTKLNITFILYFSKTFLRIITLDINILITQK